jgi:hypothetical protein
MKNKKLINEVRQLQKIAGLLNEYEFKPEADSESINLSDFWGKFTEEDRIHDQKDRPYWDNVDEIIAKLDDPSNGYTKKVFNSYDELMDSEIGEVNKENNIKIKWSFLPPQEYRRGKKFFDMYLKQYGPFIVWYK